MKSRSSRQESRRKDFRDDKDRGRRRRRTDSGDQNMDREVNSRHRRRRQNDYEPRKSEIDDFGSSAKHFVVQPSELEDGEFLPEGAHIGEQLPHSEQLRGRYCYSSTFDLASKRLPSLERECYTKEDLQNLITDYAKNDGFHKAPDIFGQDLLPFDGRNFDISMIRFFSNETPAGVLLSGSSLAKLQPALCNEMKEYANGIRVPVNRILVSKEDSTYEIPLGIETLHAGVDFAGYKLQQPEQCRWWRSRPGPVITCTSMKDSTESPMMSKTVRNGLQMLGSNTPTYAGAEVHFKKVAKLLSNPFSTDFSENIETYDYVTRFATTEDGTLSAIFELTADGTKLIVHTMNYD